MWPQITLVKDQDGRLSLTINIPIDTPEDFDEQFKDAEEAIFAEARDRMIKAFPKDQRAKIEHLAMAVEEAQTAFDEADRERDLAVTAWREASQERRHPKVIHDLHQVKCDANKKAASFEKYLERAKNDLKSCLSSTEYQLRKIGKEQIKAMPFIPKGLDSVYQKVLNLVRDQSGSLVELCKRIAVCNRFIMPFNQLDFEKLAEQVAEEFFAAAEEKAKSDQLAGSA